MVIDVRFFAIYRLFLDGVGEGLGVVLRLRILHIVEVIADRIKGYLAILIVVLFLPLISFLTLERKAEGTGFGKRRPIQLFFCGQGNACGQRCVVYDIDAIAAIEADRFDIKVLTHRLLEILFGLLLALLLKQHHIVRLGNIHPVAILFRVAGWQGRLNPIVEFVGPQGGVPPQFVVAGRTGDILFAFDRRKLILLRIIYIQAERRTCQGMVLIISLLQRKAPCNATDRGTALIVFKLGCLFDRGFILAEQLRRIGQCDRLICLFPFRGIQNTQRILQHHGRFVRQVDANNRVPIFIITHLIAVFFASQFGVVAAVIHIGPAVKELHFGQQRSPFRQGILHFQVGRDSIIRQQVQFIRVHLDHISDLVGFCGIARTAIGIKWMPLFAQEVGLNRHRIFRGADGRAILIQDRVIGYLGGCVAVVFVQRFTGHLGIICQGISLLLQVCKFPTQHLAFAISSRLYRRLRNRYFIAVLIFQGAVERVPVLGTDVAQSRIHRIRDHKFGTAFQVPNVAQIQINGPFDNHSGLCRSISLGELHIFGEGAFLAQQAAKIDRILIRSFACVAIAFPLFGGNVVQYDAAAGKRLPLLRLCRGRVGNTIPVIQAIFRRVRVLCDVPHKFDRQGHFRIFVFQRQLFKLHRGQYFLTIRPLCDFHHLDGIEVHGGILGVGGRDFVGNDETCNRRTVFQVPNIDIQFPIHRALFVRDLVMRLFDCNIRRDGLLIIIVREVQIRLCQRRIVPLEKRNQAVERVLHLLDSYVQTAQSSVIYSVLIVLVYTNVIGDFVLRLVIGRDPGDRTHTVPARVCFPDVEDVVACLCEDLPAFLLEVEGARAISIRRGCDSTYPLVTRVLQNEHKLLELVRVEGSAIGSNINGLGAGEIQINGDFMVNVAVCECEVVVGQGISRSSFYKCIPALLHGDRVTMFHLVLGIIHRHMDFHIVLCLVVFDCADGRLAAHLLLDLVVIVFSAIRRDVLVIILDRAKTDSAGIIGRFCLKQRFIIADLPVLIQSHLIQLKLEGAQSRLGSIVPINNGQRLVRREGNGVRRIDCIVEIRADVVRYTIVIRILAGGSYCTSVLVPNLGHRSRNRSIALLRKGDGKNIPVRFVINDVGIGSNFFLKFIIIGGGILTIQVGGCKFQREADQPGESRHIIVYCALVLHLGLRIGQRIAGIFLPFELEFTFRAQVIIYIFVGIDPYTRTLIYVGEIQFVLCCAALLVPDHFPFRIQIIDLDHFGFQFSGRVILGDIDPDEIAIVLRRKNIGLMRIFLHNVIVHARPMIGDVGELVGERFFCIRGKIQRHGVMIFIVIGVFLVSDIRDNHAGLVRRVDAELDGIIFPGKDVPYDRFVAAKVNGDLVIGVYKFQRRQIIGGVSFLHKRIC